MIMFIFFFLLYNNLIVVLLKKKLSSSFFVYCFDEWIVFDVVGVVGLDFGGDVGEGVFEGFFGGGVDYFGLFVLSMLVWVYCVGG